MCPQSIQSTAVQQDTLWHTCKNLFKTRVHAGLLNSFAGVLCIVSPNFYAVNAKRYKGIASPSPGAQSSALSVITPFCEKLSHMAQHLVLTSTCTLSLHAEVAGRLFAVRAAFSALHSDSCIV